MSSIGASIYGGDNLWITVAIGSVSGGAGAVIGGAETAEEILFGMATGAIVSALNGWMHQAESSKWDLNSDGILQKNEADNWFMNGKGDISVNGKNIDLSGLKAEDMTYNPKTKIYTLSTTKAFRVLPYETSATYGGSGFKLVNGQWRMLSQRYHYDLRSWNSAENVGRNALTILGRPSTMGITPSQFNQLGGQLSRPGAAYFINIKY